MKCEIVTPIYRQMKLKTDVEWMQRAGVRGVVIGNSLLFAKSPVPQWLFRHELEHAYQQIREGVILFYLKYFYYSLRYGYQDNPFEVEARARQNDPLTTTEEQLLWKLNEDLTKLQSA